MQKLIDGELHDAESILKKYERLIHKHALRFCGNDYHYKEDLMQVGNIGLLNAFEKYDADSEVKFISYAYKYARGYMRNLNRESGMIHVPPKVKATAWNIDKQGMWDLDDSEIAERLEVNLRMVESCRIFFNLKTVLSADAENEEDSSIYDSVSYENDFSHSTVVYYTENLDARERIILSKAMNGDSYVEIGNDIGISKQRVGQLFKKIKAKVELQILKESR